MLKVYCLICLIILSVNVFAADSYTLSVDEWDRPHDVNSVTSLTPLPDIVAKWSSLIDNNKSAKIDIRYPGGELGQLLAKRLHDWLVVLGVPSNAILLTPGSADITQLKLIVK